MHKCWTYIISMQEMILHQIEYEWMLRLQATRKQYEKNGRNIKNQQKLVVGIF